MEHRWRWMVLMFTMMPFNAKVIYGNSRIGSSTIANPFITTITTPTSTTTTTRSITTIIAPLTTTTTPICQLLHDTTEKVNVVFLLDRSGSLGGTTFNNTVRPLVRQILENYYTVRPTATRVAVVLFAGKSTVVMDYISTPGSSQPYQCEMFAKNGTFDQLVIKGGEHTGENLIG